MDVRALPIALLLMLASSSTSRANDFRDNPLHVIDRRQAPWALPIGELLQKNVVKKANGAEIAKVGSAFLVSPCYIMTAAHVVYDHELIPTTGKDYTLWFQAGTSTTGYFAGKTTATPIISGDRDASGNNDWALLKLNNCVGQRAEFGWLELDKERLSDSKGKDIIIVGYPTSWQRGVLALGHGHVLERNNKTDLFKTDAPVLPGQSGGPVFSTENGVLVVSGMSIAEKGPTHGATYDHYTSDHASLIADVTMILGRPLNKMLLDADKTAFGAPNPAAGRFQMDRFPH